MGCLGGRYLTELAARDERISVITAAMTDSTGFGPFAARYPRAEGEQSMRECAKKSEKHPLPRTRNRSIIHLL